MAKGGISQSEAARRHGVSQAYLNQLVQRGAIGTIPGAPGHAAVDPASAAAYFARQAQQPQDSGTSATRLYE